MSRQQKRAAIRQAGKTIGKLNHCILNQPRTVGAAKANMKNINQYMTELRSMGIIKPPSIWQRLKNSTWKIRRVFRIALNRSWAFR